MTAPPLRVIAFESRRAVEIAALVRKQGGDPFVAPAMREVALADQPEALAFADALAAGAVDVLVCLTGVGTRALIDATTPRLGHERLRVLLAGITLVARGPKPVAVLRELGLVPALVVPEPNTWRELLAVLDADLPVAGRRVAVQEYGVANPELLAGLAERGAAEVRRLPVYRWALPEDTAPLHEAVRRVASGALEVALFTSATQVTHVVQVAGDLGSAAGFAAGLRSAVVGSIGPVCSEALRSAGLPVDLEPSHPKMGPLVVETLRAAPGLLAAKGG